MVFQADTTTQPVLDAIKAHSTAPDTVRAIDEATAFTVSFTYSALPPVTTLANVQGWTFAGLYGKKSTTEPFALIAQTPDVGSLAEWAGALESAQVEVWLNSAEIGTSSARLIAAGLHEFELHVLPFYRFHMALKELGLHQSETAALTKQVKDGDFSATTQHQSPALRANQVLAMLSLVSSLVAARMRPSSGSTSASKRKTPAPDMETTSLEYNVLIRTREDVLGDDNEKLPPIKKHYDTHLATLNTKYGKDVVNYVVDQFEMD
ncbi:hypothetical protein [Actinomadura chibensis]|uniref:Uncharacterized protein n=1 Tax=Actinomadura chibensis TaxID=392828 RepID=A0A5D0NVT9_9ACTN|nr:hypothetical protein [Actinomadura chibensis]TYB48760.1 hypothetical protein FXF69_06195 [Actinomadura chibensis]